MKTFAALTAAAALIAGISFANAASNNLTGTTNAQFCAHIKATGSTDCRFATMAECEKATKPEGGTCVSNANKSAASDNMKTMKSTTTGSGTPNSTKSSADTNKTEQKNK